MNTQPSNYGPLTDPQLVAMAKNDDAVAFTMLSDRYMPVLKARVGRYSNIVGIDTDDFIQEGMLALYRAVKSFDPDTGIQFNTYAITCINNSMASAIKAHMKDINKNTDVAIDVMDEHRLHRQTTLTSAQLIEDEYLDHEAVSHRVRQIEILLSDFERHVLKLYLSGQSYQQISSVLSTTTKAVDNALQRVRRKLRPEL